MHPHPRGGGVDNAERWDGVGVACLRDSVGLIPSSNTAEVLAPPAASREEVIDRENLSRDMSEGVLFGLGSGPWSGMPRWTMGAATGAE